MNPENLHLYLDNSNLSEWASLYTQAAFVQRIDLAADLWQDKMVDRLNLTTSFPSNRLVVDRGYTLALKAVLGVLVVLIVAVFLLGLTGPSKLNFDPGSIPFKAWLMSGSTQFLEAFRGQGLHNKPSRNPYVLKLFCRDDGQTRLDFAAPKGEQQAVVNVKGEPFRLHPLSSPHLL